MILIVNNTNAEPRKERWYQKATTINEFNFYSDTAEFTRDRALIRSLSKRFGTVLEIHHTTDFEDLSSLLDSTIGHSRAVITNFPFSLGRTPRREALPDHRPNATVDIYRDTKNTIRKLLSKHPDVRLLVLTGAERDVLREPDILSLGMAGRITVRRKMDFGDRWGSAECQASLLRFVIHFIAEQIQDATGRPPPAPCPASDTEEPPRYWYEPGEVVTVHSKIPPIPGWCHRECNNVPEMGMKSVPPW